MFLEDLKNHAGVFLYRLGVSANLLTYLGLLAALWAGLLIANGLFLAGGFVCLLSGTLDLLDGSVARASGSIKKFGGILDSALDRYGDGFIFGGILFYCAANQRLVYSVLAMSALVGSFLVSYVRARSECIIKSCRVGFWERGERIVFVSLGLLVNNMTVVLWVLGILVHGTALRRLLHAARSLAADNNKVGHQEGILVSNQRLGIAYYAKVVVLILMVIFVKPSF